MTDFWNKTKSWFRTRYSRAKNWTTATYTRLRNIIIPPDKKLHPAVKYFGSFLLIGLALLGTILYARSRDDKDDNKSNPELAEVYEPSIGTPLAPDTPGNNVNRPGEVGGAVTPSPTPTPAVAPKTGVNLIAPKTGVDSNEPVSYDNDTLRFSAILPAGTNVTEKNGSVTFSSAQNAWYYTVSVSLQDSESLATIESQLRNSPSVKNIRAVSFNGIQALQFDSSKNGMVFIANGKIYYLLGDNKYFTTFKTILVQ